MSLISHSKRTATTSVCLLSKQLLNALIIASIVLSICCRPSSSQSSNSCPSMCNCIWRNGKQTAICEKQSLISIPSGISSGTQVLNLNKNNFQILPSKVFQERGLINLQKVFLAECKLGVIAEDAFTQLTNLIELDLSENLLTQVPTNALKDAFNLRRLLLNQNPISIIKSEAFLPLNGLKYLDLSGSQIDSIEPGAFRGLDKLEFLKLDSNRLTTLPITVVADLPPLYSFDLHKNQWNCDCDLRSSREWMIRNNVPQSIPPTCQTPQRVSGLMWNSLDIDDFACAPDIISTVTEVTKYVGNNVTLSCVVKGLPQPKIFWYVDDGFYRNLSSHLVRGEKFFLYEEKSEGIVNSMLTIAGLEVSDSQSFICSAENRAGHSNKNFTITVVALPYGNLLPGWSKVEVAGAVVGILSSLVFVFVLITIFLIRSRRSHHTNEDKQSPISVLKNLSPGVKCESSGLKSHVTVIGKDGNEKKPENGNNSSGYGSGGMTPDLTKTGFDLNGYHNNISATGYNDNHFTNQLVPTIGFQNSSHLSSINQSFTQLSPDLSQQQLNYNYDNYQEVYDADGYCTGLPASVAAQAFPPTYHNYQNQTFEDDSQSQQLAYDPYYQQQYPMSTTNQYLPQESLPQVSNSGQQQQYKRSPSVVPPGIVQPTVVRYSPDEGYAEEPAPFHLEGTEV